MRITNNLISDHVLNNIQKGMSRVSDLQNQLSTGKKFQTPSDNPIEVSRSLRVNDQVNKTEQYMRNLEVMQPILQQSDGVLSEITTQLNSVDTLTKQFLNASNNDNYELLASNMSEILDTVISLANSNYNGKYVFGGYNTSEVPFTREGDKIRYNGTDDVLTANISENTSIDVSIPGSSIFTTHQILGGSEVSSKSAAFIPEPSTNTFSIKVGNMAAVDITVNADTSNISLQDIADKINISGAEVNAYVKESENGYRLKLVSNFVGEDGEITLADTGADISDGLLNRLGLVDGANLTSGRQNNFNTGVLDQMVRIYNKMSVNDTDIDQELANMDLGRDNILLNYGKVGVMMQNIEQKQSLMTDMKLKQQELLSSIEDIDYAEIMTELNSEMVAYQAAIQAGARVVMPSLLDYL
ncbi:MAG: flagellar hook-associated protein 3 [Candidatus Margulisbacteria bacterium GWF2_35_9]|nr:MAG: flagellar hook-associated protein 3 [Candidatus Margulisbacteria bacterium GWF2_35_9]